MSDDEAKMADYLDNLDRIIEEHGYAVQGVFATAADPDYIPFTYTIGYHSTTELVVVGLGQSTAHGCITAAVERRILVPGTYDILLDGYSVRVVEVPPRTKDHPLSIAMRWRDRLGDADPWDFTALQLLWPDVAHRFPGDDHYDKEAFPQLILT